MCSDLFTFNSDNCMMTNAEEESNTSILTDSFCEKCQSFYYPINHTNHYACVRNDQLPFLDIKDQDLVDNCLRYDSEGVCQQCEDNFFLQNDEECVRTCDSGAYSLINYDSDGNDANFEVTLIGNNKCFSDPDEGVEIYGIDLSG